MTRRVSWIDIFKGYIIIAIVVGHSGTPEQIHDFVYSFHVAAFLFISGYTFNSQKDISLIATDRTIRLLVPYFSYNFIFYILFIVLKYFEIELFFYGNEVPVFYSNYTQLELLFWAPLAGMGWFLLTLFETTICSAILIKVIEKYRLSYLVLFLPIVALFFLGLEFSYPLYHPKYQLSPAFDINLTTIPYFLLGFLAKHYRVFDRNQLLLYSTPIFLLAIYLLAWRHNASVGFIKRDFEQWLYAIPASIAAFGCLFSISVMTETVGWLRRSLVFIGERTLPIMCLHFLGFKITSIILYMIGVCPVTFVSCNLPPDTEYFWIVLTVLSICFCLILSKLMEKNRHLSFLFLGLYPKSDVRTNVTKVLVLLVLLLYAIVFICSWNKGVFDITRVKILISGYNQREVKAGIPSLYEALESEPENPGLYGQLGDLYFKLGEYDDAIKQYQIVLSLRPNHTKTMFRLVLVYSTQNQLPKALDTLQSMRQIQPDNPEIYYDIACIYAKQNQIEESVEWLKQSIEKGFKNWDLIKKDPDIENIRNTSYVKELLKKH